MMSDGGTNGFLDARRRLCEHLRDRGISDERVLAAMEDVPRERFVPAELADDAYADIALPIGEGQTISQPFIVALMSEALKLTGEEIVLEVGTGSGYQAAVLAKLCRRVVTVERLAALSRPTEELLQSLNITNVHFSVGDGTLGCPEEAPFDGIVVTAAAPDIPAPLYKQLQEGGRLVIPVGTMEAQSLLLVTKQAGRPLSRTLCECRFVKLIGAAAWEESTGAVRHSWEFGPDAGTVSKCFWLRQRRVRVLFCYFCAPCSHVLNSS